MSTKTNITIGVIDVTVTLPIYARSEANNRDGIFVKAKRTKEQRGVVRAMVHGNVAGAVRLAARLTVPPVYTVTLTRIHRKSARPLDDDNLRGSLKAVRDGVADALGIDDGKRDRLRFRYAQEPGGDYGVRVHVTTAGGGS